MKIFKVKIYFFQSLKPKNPRPAGEIKRVSRILRKRCRKKKKARASTIKPITIRIIGNTAKEF